jgi:hypothetical protein
MDKPNRTGYIKFNLDSFEAEEQMKNALNADVLKNKIDTLYDEVFRKFYKYDQSFIHGDQPASNTEFAVVEAVWKKIHEHFKMEE